MKIKMMVIGKTSASWLEEGIALYRKRLQHYCDFELEVIPDIKGGGSLEIPKLKELEAQSFLKKLTPRDTVILLDENGKEFTSEGFAKRLNLWNDRGEKNLVFIVGGAFGFGNALHEKASLKISLSPMTFSHQMVRLIFVEQLYRGFTIIKGEPYHHK